MPSYLNIKEAAEYLGISSHTLYKLVERSEVPAAKVGGSWRLSKTALDDFLSGSSATSSIEILIVEPDSAERRELARMTIERKARLQLASSDEDASVLLDGANAPDLIVYSLSGSVERSRPFIEAAMQSSANARIALLVDPGRVAEIGELLDLGPLIVLQKPARRADLANVLSLISER